MVRAVAGRRRTTGALLALLATVAVTGCAPFAQAAPAPSPTPTATDVAPYGDGTLTMATLLPRDGDRALAEMAGLEAVARDAGTLEGQGVADLPAVKVIHHALGTADDGSVAGSVADLASRGVDVLLVRGDERAIAEVLPAAATARILVVDAGSSAALPATEDELSRIRAEDPFVVDPAAGLSVYRLGTTLLLGAVRAGDDGGLSIGRALPGLLDGPSECFSPAMCLDVLAHGDGVAYVPVAGALTRYTSADWIASP